MSMIFDIIEDKDTTNPIDIEMDYFTSYKISKDTASPNKKNRPEPILLGIV